MAPTALAATAPASLPEIIPALPLLEGAARSPPAPASLASFRRANAENLLGEEAAIAAQVDLLLALIPSTLLTGDTRVSPSRQLAVKREHLLGFGAGTLQGAHRFLRDWIAFCSRSSLPCQPQARPPARPSRARSRASPPKARS